MKRVLLQKAENVTGGGIPLQVAEMTKDDLFNAVIGWVTVKDQENSHLHSWW